MRNLLILLIFILTGLTSCAQPKMNQTPGPGSTLEKGFSKVSKVHVKGVIDLHIHPTSGKTRLALKGDRRDVVQVQSDIKNDTLYLSLGGGYPDFGNVSADLYMPHLTYLYYDGSGDVTAKNIKTNSLVMDIDNNRKTVLSGHINLKSLKASGGGLVDITGLDSRSLALWVNSTTHVQLDGVANVSHMDLSGNASLKMHWLNSPVLKVKLHDWASAQLAGITDKLDVELWDYAEFKGRYLRADNAFVRTHHESTAEISAVHKQHTLALDRSNIYYHNIPSMQTDFMAFDGSVLDRRIWPHYRMG